MGAPLAAAGLATLLSATPAPPAISAPAPAADPADAESGALSLRDLDTRMTVAVTVNGAGPFRFLVDSGATHTVISNRLAALLRLPAGDPVMLHSVGGAGVVPTVRIAALGAGALRPRPMTAPVLASDNIGAAGILGLDALARGRMVIDMARGRMTIERAETRPEPAPADATEIVVTARRRYGQLVLADADAAGQRIWAVVDTGSMTTIGNPVLRDRLSARRRAMARPVTITDVAGREIVASWAPLPDVRLSAWHIRNVAVAFCDAHAFDRFGLAGKPSMLLGMDVMRVFSRVSIDFRDRTVRLLRRGEA